ncbi:UMP kinase [Candidatus Shapirobacteria bacterium CG_4_10_14_0_2_um_filter_40_12]|uniref:Uridylate kinase n=1 Tax=Candidatus Shapirobacteria bacterium CG_4_10_14_0_2_um_filter_40_12 TaxID=1974871 RepID=A0A2M7TU62_9BACT|nr:MAG: UMP kinase [Candidatus Shapirobacteria bacterium CG_4_10_14_0_2_um_filter_40_12]
MTIKYNQPTMGRVRRAILKLSGELFGNKENHISFEKYNEVARQLVEIQKKTKIQLAVVVGGGNIFRGRKANHGVDRTQADYMGMMATIMNGIGLREALVRNGADDTRLMTSINIPQVAEPFILIKGRHHLTNGRMVVIAGGLGIPYFSTDSAVAQYAASLDCDIIFKASTVDGVYDSDPRINAKAKKYPELSYRTALDQRLGVMDITAFAMCESSGIPIFVFDIKDLARLPEAIRGNYSFGTIIRGGQ